MIRYLFLLGALAMAVACSQKKADSVVTAASPATEAAEPQAIDPSVLENLLGEYPEGFTNQPPVSIVKDIHGNVINIEFAKPITKDVFLAIAGASVTDVPIYRVEIALIRSNGEVITEWHSIDEPDLGMYGIGEQYANSPPDDSNSVVEWQKRTREIGDTFQTEAIQSRWMQSTNSLYRITHLFRCPVKVLPLGGDYPLQFLSPCQSQLTVERLEVSSNVMHWTKASPADSTAVMKTVVAPDPPSKGHL